MSDRVIVEIEDKVAHVRLNRPEKHNALDIEMFGALITFGRNLSDLVEQDEVRAVVLSGKGSSFCSGLDTAILGAVQSGDTGPARSLLQEYDEMYNYAQYAAAAWYELPVPVVVGLEGAVIGAGLQIALNADVRIAHPEARLALPEVGYGIVPDMTGIQRLRSLVSLERAKRIVFDDRPMSGADAFEYGLVSELDPSPVVEAGRRARYYAQQPPKAIQAAKRLLNAWDTTTVAEGLQAESRTQQDLLGILVSR